MVHSMGKDIRGLPTVCDMGGLSNDMMREVREEQVDQKHLNIYE
jgi:hypothetical protein